MIKYNLGCGPHEILDGYINCDTTMFPGVDVTCPLWELRGKDFKRLNDETIDEIRASHVIEHVPPNLLERTLLEWYRVLKPGGKVYVYCPNASLIFSDYISGKIDMIEASRLLFGEHDFEGNVHHLCFDKQRLGSLFTQYNFKVISYEGRPNAYRYELGIQCEK